MFTFWLGLLQCNEGASGSRSYTVSVLNLSPSDRGPGCLNWPPAVREGTSTSVTKGFTLLEYMYIMYIYSNIIYTIYNIYI